MIHYLRIRNFFSIGDEVEVSFKAGRNAPELNSFRTAPDGQRYTTLLGTFGANASGKTNVLKAFAFLLWFMKTPLRAQNDTAIPFAPFIFTPETDEPTEFFLEYSDKTDIYRYQLRLTRSKVMFEQLSMRNKAATKATYIYLFRRQANWWSLLARKLGRLNQSQRQMLLSDSVSSFSRLLALGWKPAKVAVQALSSHFTNVSSGGQDAFTIHSPQYIVEAARSYLENAALLKRVERYLAIFDTGLSGIKLKKVIDESMPDQNKAISMSGVHIVNGQEYRLGMHLESNGTRGLFAVLPDYLQVLDRGGIAIVDEIETSLHGRITEFLLSLFADKETNPHGAQLIFTTHSTNLLKQLDKRQILLVEKGGETQATSVYRLSDVQGVRNVDDYRAKYEAGVFGAVPKV